MRDKIAGFQFLVYCRSVEEQGCQWLPVKNKATRLNSEHGIQCLSQRGNTATVISKTMKKEM